MRSAGHLPIPYPLKNESGRPPTDGLSMSCPVYCRNHFLKANCEQHYKEMSADENIKQKYCPKGFLTLKLGAPKEEIFATGIVGEHSKQKMDPTVYGANKKNRTTDLEIQNWLGAISKVISMAKRDEHESLKKTLQPYHDIKRMLGAINAQCEAYALKQSGNPLRDALVKLPPEIKAIHKAVELIEQQCEIPDLLVNPELMRSGPREARKIHNSFFKVAKILDATARSGGRKIQLGDTFSELNVYGTFDLLPFILLDNAIKYSFEDQEISVQFRPVGRSLVIEITNFGPIVSSAELGQLTQLFFRGAHASIFAREGSGIGLYLANQLAQINGGSLELECVGTSNFINGIEGGNFCARLRFGVV